MSMHNPPHPGSFITEVYLEPHGLSGRELAVSLASGVSPEMALRLSKALGRSPESWLAMQDIYDLWHAKGQVDLRQVGRVRFSAA